MENDFNFSYLSNLHLRDFGLILKILKLKSKLNNYYCILYLALKKYYWDYNFQLIRNKLNYSHLLIYLKSSTQSSVRVFVPIENIKN